MLRIPEVQQETNCLRHGRQPISYRLCAFFKGLVEVSDEKLLREGNKALGGPDSLLRPLLLVMAKTILNRHLRGHIQ